MTDFNRAARWGRSETSLSTRRAVITPRRCTVSQSRALCNLEIEPNEQ